MSEVRIRLPREYKKGDVISVRALVEHPMEIIARDKDGKVIEKNYNFIHTVTITFNGKPVMKGEITQAVSANPFLEFPLRVSEPGTLQIVFEDTMGKKYTGTAEVKF